MNKFLTLFSDEKAKLAADQESLTAKALQLERNEFVAAQRDSRLNAVDAAESRFKEKCKALDEAAQEISEADFVEQYILGVDPVVLAIRAIGKIELGKRLPKLKVELDRIIVAPVKKALVDFERENRAILVKLPQPKKQDAPTLLSKPVVEWSDFSPLPDSGARRMMGLAPGEILPAPAWQTNANLNRGMNVRDADED